MNVSLIDAGHDLLVVSQFTLYATHVAADGHIYRRGSAG